MVRDRTAPREPMIADPDGLSLPSHLEDVHCISEFPSSYPSMPQLPSTLSSPPSWAPSTPPKSRFPQCCQPVIRFLQTHMAFRPPVTQDPRTLSKKKKRGIITCLAFGSSLNGLCSTIYFPGLPNITTELQATTMSVQLTTSLFILFGGIGPIFWGSMSDYYHIRRFLYLVSLLIFSVASVGCALVTNIWALVVLRCIQSVGTSVTMSVGAGTVSDCWEVTERGAAFSVLFVGQFFGPLVGPIIGGGLTTGLGWRSTFWFCFIYGLFLFWLIFTFLPETYREEERWKTLPVAYSEKAAAAAQAAQAQGDENTRPVSVPLATPSLVSQSPTPPPGDDDDRDATRSTRDDAEDGDDIHALSSTTTPRRPSRAHSASSSSTDSLPSSLASHPRNSLSSTLAHAGMTEYNVTHYATNPEEHANGTEIAVNQVQIDKNASALPETRSPASAATTSAAQKKKSFNPLTSIMLLRHMFVWMVAIEIGIVFGSMFTIETLIPELYTQNYGFASWQTGLSFLGAGLGNLIGSYVSGKISDRLLKRARARRGGAALAEDRITLNAWPGGFILIPIGLLLFGWPIQYLLTVWISIIGFAIVCFGMSQVYSAGSAYLVDCIPGRGASVTAACNLFRMTMACILSLIGQPVVAAIGTGFFMTILAVLNIFGMVLFVLVKWKGQLMRQWAGYGENIA